MGSGTTAKMAHLQKRNWIGSELSEEYVRLAEKRIDPYLRQKTLF
jgi:site-specific DNA-methyltransferase (adenine-specific)